MTDQRALQPGTGAVLRQTYVKLLVVAVLAAVITIGFPLYLTSSSTDDPRLPTLLTGCVVLGLSWVCALIALFRGRAAVQGDRVNLPAIGASQTLACIGSLTGWLGAPLVLLIGVVQHYQDADNALLAGIAMGAAALIPALCNDSAHRIAKQLTI